MFIQFTLKNFLSFKEETTLDMTAINAYKEHENNLIEIGRKEKFLRVAAIYGANASGKSNLYLAIRLFQKIIKESLNNADDNDKLAISKYYMPFEFDREKENTEFEIIMIIDDYEYKYGFEYNDKQIVSEWLYRKNILVNRNTIIFERGNDSIKFGASVSKECYTYIEQIPNETLVLTFFKRLKLKTGIFSSVFSSIMDMLVADTDAFEDFKIIDNILPDVIDYDKEDLLAFLAAIDTGIKDISYDPNDKDTTFWSTHYDSEQNEYKINFFNESKGTIKSIIVYVYAKLAIANNACMFVDELNVKLHPLLLKFIIDLFYNNSTTAQLIYTTHDTTLLDKKFFRRDQIWFVQKDDVGHSRLSALSDFKVRSDASFEKDYLGGVYGGIPLIKDYELREGE
ncbi:transporter [Lacrimispora xylanolytica]